VFEGTLNICSYQNCLVFGCEMGKQEGPEDTAVVVAGIQMSIHVCAIVNRASGTWKEGRSDN